MKILNSLLVAIGMYSKIPVPRVEWNKDNMKYSLCFFPIVGVIIGGISYFVMMLCNHLQIGIILTSVLMTMLPILITGGIHMDGFMDTVDALSSYGDKEKKLNILKDPHTGAFAAMFCAVYLLAVFGLWSELDITVLPLMIVSYIMSRTLSGLSVTTFPLAKNTGLAATFSDNADKNKCRIVLVVELVCEVASLILINPVAGAIVIACAAIAFAYHYYVCIHHFGGITGDLAGYFLQICELMILIGIFTYTKINF